MTAIVGVMMAKAWCFPQGCEQPVWGYGNPGGTGWEGSEQQFD
jgi:hypothetical protein